MVRPEPLTAFQDLFADMGFAPGAFTPSYGLAETTLAATFAPSGQGLLKHTIDMERYERTSEAVEATELTKPENKRTFVACGQVLPDHAIEIRDFQDNVLGEKQVGRICLKGPSVSPGYFRNKQATEASFAPDGWLDTGDLGYWLGDQVVVTGRFKDLVDGPALLQLAVRVIKRKSCFCWNAVRAMQNSLMKYTKPSWRQFVSKSVCL